MRSFCSGGALCDTDCCATRTLEAPPSVELHLPLILDMRRIGEASVVKSFPPPEMPFFEQR